jgi:hypothetical protein
MMEHELNAMAALLNECKDKDGAILRPSMTTLNRAWEAISQVTEREVLESN